MEIQQIHSWEMDYPEATALQERLRERLTLYCGDTEISEISIVAGADVSYDKGGDVFFAGVVVMDINSFEVLERSSYQDTVTFPYIPGLLSFREGPVLLKAFEGLETKPQAVIIDGQGIAHQRGFGLASHMGLILKLPTVGCAKTRLVGKYEEVGDERGSMTPLEYRGELVGYVVRTRSKIKPVFVSPGDKIDHTGAAYLVLSSTKGYRLPEPVREAHRFVNRLRKAWPSDGLESA